MWIFSLVTKNRPTKFGPDEMPEKKKTISRGGTNHSVKEMLKNYAHKKKKSIHGQNEKVQVFRTSTPTPVKNIQ